MRDHPDAEVLLSVLGLDSPATRMQVLEAAQQLFEQDGYAATSMAAIASEAGVSLKTVYLAFETKSGLLRALWHVLLHRPAAPQKPRNEFVGPTG